MRKQPPAKKKPFQPQVPGRSAPVPPSNPLPRGRGSNPYTGRRGKK